MKSPLIKLTSNQDDGGRDQWGAPVFVSALAIQGIEPGEEIYESDKDEKSRRTTGTGEWPIGRGALVWWADQSHSVRESVAEVERMVEAKLRDLSSR